MNKDIKALVKRMQRDGWDLERRRKGFTMVWKTGFKLYVHYTVSDVRAVHNMCSNIRRFTGLDYRGATI